ncbi:hypothetical protein MNBD_IGNAVI01-478 [hydrothermal vent metagenome]|uniref:Transcriptional regulator HTH-type FeoC domain-containing protein n=1 Tax=hydrothermal vent metagenome TaxID=652676 RepID=A0A3B1CZR9_9ZZZZ
MMNQKGGMPMMGMMRKMMEDTSDFNPMEMCQDVLRTVTKVSEMSFYATPEIRLMFEEWLASIEDEIFEFVQSEKEVNIDSISEHFKISKEAAKFFLNHLAASGKVKAEFNDNMSSETGNENNK